MKVSKAICKQLKEKQEKKFEGLGNGVKMILAGSTGLTMAAEFVTPQAQTAMAGASLAIAGAGTLRATYNALGLASSVIEQKMRKCEQFNGK